jgi:hypothetical protein
MIDFHTHWIPSGLPGLAARAADFPLPVHADPAGAFVARLDGAEAGWVRDGTAHVLLGLR